MDPSDLEEQERKCPLALRRHLSAINNQMLRAKKARYMAFCIQEGLQDHYGKTKKMMVKNLQEILEARRKQALIEQSSGTEAASSTLRNRAQEMSPCCHHSKQKEGNGEGVGKGGKECDNGTEGDAAHPKRRRYDSDEESDSAGDSAHPKRRRQGNADTIE